MSQQTGFLQQTSFGNREVVIPWPDGGLAHFSRLDDQPGRPWVGPVLFGRGDVSGVSFVESDYHTLEGAGHGNFELLAVADGQLVFYWREDTGPWTWHGPEQVFPAGRFAGHPSFAQVGFKRGWELGEPDDHRNFVGCVPALRGDVAYIIRHNNRDELHEQAPYWSSPSGFAIAPDRFKTPARVLGVSFLVTTVGTPRGVWDDEYCYLGEQLAVAIEESGQLDAYVRTQVTNEYGAPIFVWEWVHIGVGYQGQPSLMQSDYNAGEGRWLGFDSHVDWGNYELVAPRRGGGLAHFYQGNGSSRYGGGADAMFFPGEIQTDRHWQGPFFFADGYEYDEVSMIQGNTDADDGHGRIELVARRRGQRGFDFWWRDGGPAWSWHGPRLVGEPGWRPWFEIRPDRQFDHRTQHLAALARKPDHVDLFVIGNNDTVWSTWWEGSA
jgi:hypothetical protein